MKKIKILILSFASILISQAVYAQQFVLPFGSYLDGVGAFYGVGAGKKNLINNKVDLYAGKSFNRVDAFGVLATNIPFFHEKLKLSLAYANVSSFDHEISYTRGLSEGTVIRQELKGSGKMIALAYNVIPEKLKLNVSYLDSEIDFKDFKTLDGKTINVNRAAIHEVTPKIITLGATGNLIEIEKRNRRDIILDLSVTDITGRNAQSDVRIWGLKTRGTEKFTPIFKLNYTVVLQKTDVTKESGVVTINAQCSARNTDPEIIRQCQGFESDFDSSIIKSNKYGSANPIGGSRGLRSYREFRFRAANTFLSGLEAEWLVFEKAKMKFSLVSFAELGQANDEFSKLFDQSRYSAGFGGRLMVNEAPIRLEFATGNEDQTVFLALGQAW